MKLHAIPIVLTLAAGLSMPALAQAQNANNGNSPSATACPPETNAAAAGNGAAGNGDAANPAAGANPSAAAGSQANAAGAPGGAGAPAANTIAGGAPASPDAKLVCPPGGGPAAAK